MAKLIMALKGIYTTKYANGQLATELYYYEDKLHNTNGPAMRSWHDNGQLKHNSFYVYGKLHNPNGPAKQYWDLNVKLKIDEYWLDGEYYPSFEELKQALKISCLK